MDLLTLKRHLPSIEEGRWVDSREVKDLKDVRVKVRGSSSRPVRELYAAKERAAQADLQGDKRMETMQRIGVETLAEIGLVDIEGLTQDGEPVSVEDVRRMILLPEFQPLADLVSRCALVVERTREAHIKDIAGN
jgi:citrate lyase synthetase